MNHYKFCILLYSKYSPMSKKLLQNLKKCPINLNDELGLKYVCVDSEKIRKRIVASENINVNTMPAFLISHMNGKIELFEGDKSFHWIQKIVQTKLNARKQEAQRAQQEANQRAQQEANQRAQQEANQRAQQEANLRAQQEANQRAQQEANQRAQQVNQQEVNQRLHERKQQYRAQTQQQVNNPVPTNQSYNEETPIDDIIGTTEEPSKHNNKRAMSLSSIAKSMQQDRDILDNKHNRTIYQRQYPHDSKNY